MDQIKKYLPIVLIVLFAVIVTGLALYTQGSDTLNLGRSDTWGIPLWLTPMGYLLLALIFKGGVAKMNQPVYALLAFFVFSLAGVTLFFPLPAMIQWHFIIGAPTIAYILFG